ncbi:MAG: hypothetical protein L6Q75_02035 [Burkholderiaceae bacterium]|nr:hypothetical protein [Burkholderiaceae bacterium]
MSSSSRFPAGLRRAPVLLVLACVGAAVQAETSPYYLGANLGVTSDSNVRRARDGQEQRDTITTAGLRAGIDQPLGRSRLLVDLSADHRRYNRVREYDHTDYSLLGRLDWATVERLSGNLVATANQTLYQDTSRADTQRTLLRNEGLSAQARLGVVTRLTFEAGAAANRNRYSSSTYRSSNLDQTSYNAALVWAPSPDLSTRLGLRHTDARYPEYSAAGANDVDRDDVNLGLVWRPSGASTLDATLARTRESHSRARQRDGSSWTGALGWTWQASGKSSIGLRVSRDSTVGSYGEAGLAYSDASDARMRDSVTLSTGWQATSKVRLDARIGYARRTLDAALKVPGDTLTQTTRDRTTTASLGVNYELLRNLELGCSLSWENRGVSNELSSLTYAYSDNSLGCYAQAFLR